MVNCILCGKTRHDLISLFKIPENDSKLKWLQFIMEEGKIEIDFDKEYFLCEHHFDKNSIMIQSSKKVLKPNSIPTIKVFVVL